MSERVWIRVLCPVAITTLSELSAAAPKDTFIRHGGTAVVGCERLNVMEFVVVEAPASDELTVSDIRQVEEPEHLKNHPRLFPEEVQP